ncbi:acylphosphatase-2-like [Calliphora vicina]|uniref:acylphosphatase-2-like n=1 Tax=Calliphora vicina TaxID=7373 RepID=UPI00325A6A97
MASLRQLIALLLCSVCYSAICKEHFCNMPQILHCEFEVFGIVQGVSFRMFTEKQAKSLGVRGWCMNTRNDTVKGEIEAPPEEFAQMKIWLEKTGSPTSRIDKVIFGDIKEIDSFTFESFSIKY